MKAGGGVNAEIIAIGTELLLGFVVNTDTAFLGRRMAELGIDCYHQVTVGDNPQRLAEAIQTALSRADLVITCGGLGPTVDDITLETIARATATPLALNRPILKQIRARFARLKIQMPESNVRQAMIPEGAIVFPNSSGTAPGFLLTLELSSPSSIRQRPPRGVNSGEDKLQRGPAPDPIGGSIPAGVYPRPSPRKGGSGAGMTEKTKLLAALPGPPAELIPMATRHLLPRLRRWVGKSVIRSRTLKVTGITESEVDAKIRDLLALTGAATVGIYAHPAQVDLRISAKAPTPAAADRLIARIERTLRRRLGNLIYGADEETLEQVVGNLLRKKKHTLAVAESCTGGLTQHRITEVPGSSDYFLGGAVVYSNDLKESFLGVPPELLKKYGAVSPQVASAMAAGIRRATGSDMGISVTGIAGPTGGTKHKPVGLVYIALSSPRGTGVARHQLSGARSVVKFKASQAALDTIRLHLAK